MFDNLKSWQKHLGFAALSMVLLLAIVPGGLALIGGLFVFAGFTLYEAGKKP